MDLDLISTKSERFTARTGFDLYPSTQNVDNLPFFLQPSPKGVL